MNKYINSKAIEARFKVKLPKRYKDFLDNGENEKFSGWYGEIPSYENRIKVFFTGKELESFINEEWPEDDESYGHPAASEDVLTEGLVPLATLGQEESQFLALDTRDEKCPVVIYEHETAEFEPVSDTLDEFLKSLSKGK